MQKNNLFTFLIFILVLSVVSIPSAKSQSTANLIYINPDGSIDPQTAPIQRNGDVYTLTGNISGSMAVHKSNIVIDGAGYALNGNGGTGIDLTGNLTEYPSPNEILNVTVENLRIMNFNWSIDTHGGGMDTFYQDYVGNTTNDVGSEILLYWNNGRNNLTYCTITGTIGIELSSGNTITENNLLGGIFVNLGGNATIDRNYWSDYLTRYPNATEIGSSGIGNIPYIVDTYSNGAVAGSLQDNHPLMNPVTVANFPTLSPSVITTSSPAPSVPEFQKWIILPLVLVATLLIIQFVKKESKKQ